MGVNNVACWTLLVMLHSMMFKKSDFRGKRISHSALVEVDCVWQIITFVSKPIAYMTNLTQWGVH